MKTTAIIGHYMDPPTEFDTERLEWRSGYPSSTEDEQVDWGVWLPDGNTRVAHLETAIVRDTVSAVWGDGTGPATHEHQTELYDRIHTCGAGLHYLYVAWRLVRDADGAVLYDSLDAGAHHRVVRADIPLGFGNRVREAVRAGQLPGVQI